MRISVNEEPAEDENYIVVAPYEQSQSLADCRLVIADLDEAILLSDKVLSDPEFEKLMSGQANDLPKATELKALWSAAVICYIRCFNNGTRIPVDPKIYKSYPGALDAHSYFLDLRNKYIAHSVGSFEDSITTITLSPISSRDRKVLSVGVLQFRQALPDAENVRTLANLSNIAKNVVVGIQKKLEAEVITLAAQESIEDLYKLPYASLKIPGIDRLKRNRKKP